MATTNAERKHRAKQNVKKFREEMKAKGYKSATVFMSAELIAELKKLGDDGLSRTDALQFIFEIYQKANNKNEYKNYYKNKSKDPESTAIIADQQKKIDELNAKFDAFKDKIQIELGIKKGILVRPDSLQEFKQESLQEKMEVVEDIEDSIGNEKIDPKIDVKNDEAEIAPQDYPNQQSDLFVDDAPGITENVEIQPFDELPMQSPTENPNVNLSLFPDDGDDEIVDADTIPERLTPEGKANPAYSDWLYHHVSKIADGTKPKWKEIAAELNSKDIVSARGKAFTGASVSMFIKRESEKRKS